MTDLGTLGLTGSGFEVAAPDVAGLNGHGWHDRGRHRGLDRASRWNRSGRRRACSTKASIRYRRPALADRTVRLRQQHPRQHPEAGADPAAGRRRHGPRRPANHLAERQRRGVRSLAHRAGAGARELRQRAHLGHRARAEAGCTATCRCRRRSPISRAGDTGTDLPPNIEGGTPAPQLWLSARYTRPAAAGGWNRTSISAGSSRTCRTLDLGDRRTGAGRSRASIQAFFRNGATRARLGQRRRGRHPRQRRRHPDRRPAKRCCRSRIACWARASTRRRSSGVAGLRHVRRARRRAVSAAHELIVDCENLNDENYRGISWGVDAPGRGVSVRYVGAVLKRRPGGWISTHIVASRLQGPGRTHRAPHFSFCRSTSK